MPRDLPYRTVVLTPTFLESLVSKDFTTADQRAILRALVRLDEDERHPSLRVHQLLGPAAGTWSASASSSLRIVFVRWPDGQKVILGCSKHYDR